MPTKFDPDDALVRTEDRERAEDHLTRIKTGFAEAPDLLSKFITQEEWRHLGYLSIEDCFLRSGLLEAIHKGETSRKVVVDALRKKGFTVRQIAAKLEISPATVSRTVTGKTGNEAREDRKGEGESGGPEDVTSNVTTAPLPPQRTKPPVKPVSEPDLGAPGTAADVKISAIHPPVPITDDVVAAYIIEKAARSHAELVEFVRKVPALIQMAKLGTENQLLTEQNAKLTKDLRAARATVDRLRMGDPNGSLKAAGSLVSEMEHSSASS